MRIVFAGTPDPAVVALQHLIDSGHDVCGRDYPTRCQERPGENHAPIAGGGDC